MKPHVVIGGGIGGLIAAWSLQRRDPGTPVVVLEQAPVLGGLLNGVHYRGAGAYFDQGTHIFQETGDAEIDGFLRSAVPEEELILLPPRAGDLAGAVFSGRLQVNSHFPDLRSHPQRRELTESMLAHASRQSFHPDFTRAEPLLDAARRRFGPVYTDTVLAPMLTNLYRIDAQELAAFALLLPGLTRAIVFGPADWSKMCGLDAMRAILGFPDQRLLPDEFRHTRRSFYTKREGSSGVIHGLVRALEASGVRFETCTRIQRLEPQQRRVSYTTGNDEAHTVEAESIFLATGVVGAARLMGLPLEDLGLTPPLLHRLVHLVLDEPADADLHYFYGLDPSNSFYRVTHYRGFAGQANDRRLTIEVLERPEILDADLPDLLLSELHALGFVNSTESAFARVERLPNGFPRPTTANLAGVARLQAWLAERLPTGMRVGGAGSGPGLFFTNEILVDIHRTIQSASPSR